jgi:hypothetical protein
LVPNLESIAGNLTAAQCIGQLSTMRRVLAESIDVRLKGTSNNHGSELVIAAD